MIIGSSSFCMIVKEVINRIMNLLNPWLSFEIGTIITNYMHDLFDIIGYVEMNQN